MKAWSYFEDFFVASLYETSCYMNSLGSGGVGRSGFEDEVME